MQLIMIIMQALTAGNSRSSNLKPHITNPQLLFLFPVSKLYQQDMATASFPPNVHISTHPCLTAKLSQLRSQAASPRDIKALVHEIALIIGCEALSTAVKTKSTGTVSLYLLCGKVLG